MFAAVENNSGTVPAFLIKLWTLVEDPSTDELIHWDASGTSFHVYDQQRFSREILPLYFKHNNIASFIRQLNMYGFRKVTHIDQGGLKIEKDDLQFQHQYFQRGERDLLQYIKRKVSSQAVRTTDHLAAAKADEVSRVLTDMKQVKSKQDSMDQNLEYIKRENKLLWREVAMLRQKHHKQQQIVNKLIQFLVSLVSSNRAGLTIPSIRRVPLAINDVSQLTPQGTSTAAPAASVVPDIQVPTGSTPQIIPSPAPIETVEGMSDDVNYKIESPKIGDFLLSPTTTASGPIIHELTDSPQSYLVQTSPMLTTASPSQTTSNVVYVPHVQVQPVSSVSGQRGDTQSNSSFIMSSKQDDEEQRDSNPVNFLMSPKIEEAPSLEDALNFGLNVPSSSNTASVVTSGSAQNKDLSPLQELLDNARYLELDDRKRKGSVTATAPSDTGVSPVKRLSTLPKPAAGSSSSNSMSAAQTASLNNLVKANSDLNSSGSGDSGAAGSSDASLAVTAPRDNDEFTLSSDQLDLLSTDLDGLKGILQEHYKVDPSFLMDLFDSSNPWAVISEKDLDELKTDQQVKEEAGLSGAEGNITGTELVEYNPRDELFPELMDDNVIGDIDDID